MCNIAGYIGKKQAAPILLEMMKRSEGFAGGYYTGLAVMEGEKLHYAKAVGDTADLLRETDAAELPGGVGIIHSRSKSGGDREWSHPFVSTREDLAYVANGALCSFKSDALALKHAETARRLAAKGHVFRSRVAGALGEYPYLEDGTAVHISDLMCQYVADLIDGGMTPGAAMSRAFTDLPAEVVGLIIRTANPGSIFVTRVNYPMMIGIADDGDTYIASTALAFPDDVHFRLIESLPAAATCEVFEGGWRVLPDPVEVGEIAPITPGLWRAAYDRLEAYLTDNAAQPPRFDDAVAACADLWREQPPVQGYQLVYEILRDFRKQGRLEILPTAAEGAFDGYTAYNFRLRIK